MSRNFFFSIAILAVFYCSSCKTMHVLHVIQTKDVEVAELTNRKKIVEFIPMHHVGKREFYDGVKEIIAHYKSEGFVVYYEGAGMIIGLDSITRDHYERKFRRMLGVYVDTT